MPDVTGRLINDNDTQNVTSICVSLSKKDIHLKIDVSSNTITTGYKIAPTIPKCIYASANNPVLGDGTKPEK